MLFSKAAKQLLTDNASLLAPHTVRTYKYNIQKLVDFAPKLQCKEITSDFVRNYRDHLEGKGNKENTINKSLAILRIFTNILRDKNLLKEDPFKKIKFSRTYTHRDFLSIEELQDLYHKFLAAKDSLSLPSQNAMTVFLFSCFTGLRYSDLKSLTAEEIEDFKIRKKTHKNGEPVYIPIPPQAQALIPQPCPEKIFHVVDNANFNKDLRKAAKTLNFSKRLHCHMARHTFATTCIFVGIPLHITSKLLGHRNLSTTLIYAKYVDLLLDKEMEKFGQVNITG